MQNEPVRNLKKEVLSDNWYRLEKVTYELQLKDGSWETQTREAGPPDR